MLKNLKVTGLTVQCFLLLYEGDLSDESRSGPMLCALGVHRPVRGKPCWRLCGVSGPTCHCMAARLSSLLTCSAISPSKLRRRPSARCFQLTDAYRFI